MVKRKRGLSMSTHFKVMGYQKNFQVLTLELKKADELAFDVLLLKCLSAEFNKGFMHKRILKPNKKGTRVDFEAIKNGGEAQEKLKQLVDECNKKHELDLIINFKEVAVKNEQKTN
jgi:hypothetical protein